MLYKLQAKGFAFLFFLFLIGRHFKMITGRIGEYL